MTRAEEIRQQAQADAYANRLTYPQTVIKYGFIHGAEWADANPDGKMLLHVLDKSSEQAKKQMLDKACEWWENELTYPSMTPEEIKWYKNKINAFRKALKDV